MNVFDQGARFATANEPAFVLTRVLALARLDVHFRTWFNAQTVPLPRGPDRIADLVALMDDPSSPEEPWLLVHEFQSQHDPRKLGTMLIEAAVFREHARDPLNDERAVSRAAGADLSAGLVSPTRHRHADVQQLRDRTLSGDLGAGKGFGPGDLARRRVGQSYMGRTCSGCR